MSPLASKDKDLFESSTMTFGEHLEELRRCLIKAIYGLVLGFVVALPPIDMASTLVDYIKSPLETALQEFYLTRSTRYITEKLDVLKAEGVPTPPLDEVQQAIMLDRMLPGLVFIDPRNVFGELRKEFPEQFSELQLPILSSVDILHPNRFATELYTEQEQEGPSPAKRVWSLLDEEGRELVKKYGDPKQDPAPPPMPEEDRQKLAAAVLKVLGNKDFFHAEDYAVIANSPPSFVLTEGDKRRQAQYDKYLALSARKESMSTLDFNRGLLGAAFPLTVSTGVRRASMLPLIQWKSVDDDPRTSLRSLSAQEMFYIYIKAAVILAFVLASPWVFYQMWNFVAAGLYPHERRYIYMFLPISVALFLGGVALAFFFVFQPVLEFLLMFNDWMDVDPDIRISEWFGFAMFLPVGFGIAFQLPVVMVFLERIGVFNVQMYTSKWRISVLVIFIISMFLTPADPYSMLLMAVPLTILYGGGILLCKFLPRGRNPFDEPDALA